MVRTTERALTCIILRAWCNHCDAAAAATATVAPSAHFAMSSAQCNGSTANVGVVAVLQAVCTTGSTHKASITEALRASVGAAVVVCNLLGIFAFS